MYQHQYQGHHPGPQPWMVSPSDQQQPFRGPLVGHHYEPFRPEVGPARRHQFPSFSSLSSPSAPSLSSPSAPLSSPHIPSPHAQQSFGPTDHQPAVPSQHFPFHHQAAATPINSPRYDYYDDDDDVNSMVDAGLQGLRGVGGGASALVHGPPTLQQSQYQPEPSRQAPKPMPQPGRGHHQAYTPRKPANNHFPAHFGQV